MIMHPKSLMASMLMGLGISTIGFRPHSSVRKPSKRYPTMVTSTPEDIAAHNKGVKTRQVIRRKTRPWNYARLS